MLERSFGLLFFLKQAKNHKGAVKPIYMRITVNGVFRDISIKRFWDTKHWNAGLGRAKGNREEDRELNSYLELLSSKVYQAKKQLVDEDREVTAEGIKNVLLGREEEKHMILAAFKQHNEQMKALIGKDFAKATFTRYKTAHDHTEAFIKWKYGKNDLDVKELNYEFASQFAFWLKSKRNCQHNATVKYISNLKKIVLECMKKGWLLKDPFADFKTNRKEVIRIALTKGELKRIEDKDFENDRLNHVKDIFLFSCYTGLAYIDAYKLKRSDIVIGVDDGNWIVTTRQKTESATRLPLLPAAQRIMDKYSDHPKCMNNDAVLPILTNQKMNSYLKEIADVCKIDKNLTFHIARHTFATTVTLSNGVPIETVSRMLGHKSLKLTQHYAKIVDLKISEDMQVLRQKLEPVQ